MNEFISLKKRISDLEKLIAIERKGYDNWFKKYHDLYVEMWHVIERIAFLLNLECVKEGHIACCCKYNNANPIFTNLEKLLKKVGAKC